MRYTLHETDEAHRAIVATAWSAEIEAPVLLMHSTAGFEPAVAGPVQRWTEGYWAVWFMIGGARGGREYSLAEETAARTHFAQLT